MTESKIARYIIATCIAGLVAIATAHEPLRGQAASASTAMAGSVCYQCADTEEGYCSWARCISWRNGYSYCWADNAWWRCHNGCWMEEDAPCGGLGALQLEGSFAVDDAVEPASHREAGAVAYEDRTIGAVWRACADLIVKRRYDVEAARRVRALTAQISL